MTRQTPNTTGDKPRRDPKGRYLKGSSGCLHPPGRPKGRLEAKAIEATLAGQELLDFWLRVMRDNEQRMDYRIRCSENIATWGFAKPKEETHVELSGGPVLFNLVASSEALKAL